LIERALSRESDGRFPDARSMLCALEACGPMAAQPSTTLAWAQAARRRIKEAARRPREMMVVGATLALCALWSGHTAIAEAVRSGFPHAFQQPTESAHGVRGTPDVTPDAAGAAALQASALVQEEAPQPPSRALEATPPAARPATKPATLPGSAARTSEAVQPQAHDRAPDALVRARALSKKGLLLYLHAELDAAYAVYRQASLLAPDEPAAFRGLGLAASRLGRTYEARRAFTRYLELAPDAADARLIRARLAQLISEEATRGLRSAHNEPPPA
jgi:hypothetical protein